MLNRETSSSIRPMFPVQHAMETTQLQRAKDAMRTGEVIWQVAFRRYLIALVVMYITVSSFFHMFYVQLAPGL